MATKAQTDVAKGLEALGYDFAPDESKKVGGPINMTISDASLDALKGRTVEVAPDATVTVL